MNNVNPKELKKATIKMQLQLTTLINQAKSLNENIQDFAELLDGDMENVSVAPTATATATVTNSNEIEKRKPGRPRKNETPESVVTVEEQNKRKPGRPRKEKPEVVQNTPKRKPGRPRKEKPEVAQNTPKRKPGRPKKEIPEVNVENTTKGSPGRPRKAEVKLVVAPKNNNQKTEADNNRRGRPSLDEILNEANEEKYVAEMNRINFNASRFNTWQTKKEESKTVATIENGTYLGVIEGFFSSGTSGRYGVTTRVYLNPNSNLLDEKDKMHISTACVNRIRYVDSEEEGLDYIEKQKEKLSDTLFVDILPKVMADHGKKGSVYAFNLDKEIRREFNKFRTIYNHKKTETSLV